MIRILIYGLVIYAIYRFLKSKGLSFATQKEQSFHDSTSVKEAELIQDPQCGAYFLKQNGVKARVQGRTLYFCSEICRDEYLKTHQS